MPIRRQGCRKASHPPPMSTTTGHGIEDEASSAAGRSPPPLYPGWPVRAVILLGGQLGGLLRAVARRGGSIGRHGSPPQPEREASASASNLSGISRPSALVVLTLTTSSNFVGSITGRSPGFSPLRIRSGPNYLTAPRRGGDAGTGLAAPAPRPCATASALARVPDVGRESPELADRRAGAQATRLITIADAALSHARPALFARHRCGTGGPQRTTNRRVSDRRPQGLRRPLFRGNPDGRKCPTGLW
jgi:hypothetical protein